MILFDQLQAAVKRLGGEWKDGHNAINIVGVRNTQDLASNAFNDLICVAWRDEQASVRHRVLVCAATTDPGVYYRENPLNVAGTAILPIGHYKRLWRLGKHQGKYTALVQLSPIQVWRDNNKDKQLDQSNLSEPGQFGINLHRANENTQSTIVDKWSAGCQVIADPKDFYQLLILAQRHADSYGNHFDYTLITDRDLTNAK